MTFEELLLVDPITLDSNSIYDVTEHLPFPTLDYVEKESGVNMIIGVGGEVEAKTTIRMITKMTRDFIYGKILNNTRDQLEFLIAKDVDFRKAFVDMVCAVIFYARIKGLDAFLQTGAYDMNDLPKSVQIKGAMLFSNHYNFYLTQEQIRSDY